MKKSGIGIIVAFFLVILASCSAMPQDSAFRLNVPTNITIERNILSFDAVEGAQSYILSINGDNTEISDTTYTFTLDGEYRVRIQAISSLDTVADSLFSDALIFKVRFLNYPEDIRISNNQVVFTKDTDAESYDVEINGVVFNSKADLPPYLEPGTYDIRIKARSDQYNESDFSPITTLTVEKSDRLVTSHNYQYSLNSKFELPLYSYNTPGLNYIEVVETLIEAERMIEIEELLERRDFYAFNNTIYFSTSYMNYLTKLLKDNETSKNMVVTFVVRTNLGDHEVSVELNYLNTPYSYTGQNQVTNFKDNVIFGFDIFDYVFVKVEGYSITDTNYDYDSGVLTIYMDYLLKTYATVRTQDRLEFTVIFEKDDVFYKYPIYISK